MPRLITRAEITAKKPLIEIPAAHAASWGPRVARHLEAGGAIDAGDRFHVLAAASVSEAQPEEVAHDAP